MHESAMSSTHMSIATHDCLVGVQNYSIEGKSFLVLETWLGISGLVRSWTLENNLLLKLC